MNFRRITSLRVLLSASVFVATASPLSAQAGAIGSVVHHIFRFVVSGGATLPAGELKDFHDTGFHADGAVLIKIPGIPFALRPELSYTKLKFKNGVIPPTALNGDASTKLLSGLGNIEIPLLMGLYVIGGAGAMNLKSDVGTTSDITQTKLLIDAGAGLRFHIKAIDGFVEARVGSASYEKGKVGYSKAQFIPVTFGLVF